MKVALKKDGSSYTVEVPRELVDKYGPDAELELTVEDDQIVLRPVADTDSDSAQDKPNT